MLKFCDGKSVKSRKVSAPARIGNETVYYDIIFYIYLILIWIQPNFWSMLLLVKLLPVKLVITKIDFQGDLANIFDQDVFYYHMRSLLCAVSHSSQLILLLSDQS